MDLQKFTGKFILVDQTNLDEYLKAIGVNIAKRAMVMATTARVECTLKGDEWTVIFAGPKDKSTTFKLGQEFEDETPDGRKVKVLVDIVRDKLVGTERWEGKEAVMTHQLLDDDHWFTTMEFGQVKATRKYKRQ